MRILKMLDRVLTNGNDKEDKIKTKIINLFHIISIIVFSLSRLIWNAFLPLFVVLISLLLLFSAELLMWKYKEIQTQIYK